MRYREDNTSLSPSQEGELAHQMLGQMGIRVVSEAEFAAMPQAPVAPAIKPVASRYTIIVPLKGKKAIAFNSRSHNFVIFGPKELKRWKKLEEGGYANLSHPDLMVFAHLGFVVPRARTSWIWCGRNIGTIAMIRARWALRLRPRSAATWPAPIASRGSISRPRK